MLQTDFELKTKNVGGVYVPTTASPRYELVAIAVAVGNGNNRIQVIVLNADGTPDLGAWAHHSYGENEVERKQYMGGLPAQFNLGPGSHYSVLVDPPNRITIEGLPSDEVRVGNSNLIGFAHTEWTLTFRRTSGAPAPVTPPESGVYITREQFNAALDRAKL